MGASPEHRSPCSPVARSPSEADKSDDSSDFPGKRGRKFFERQAAYEREKRKRREQGRDDDVKRPKQGVWKDDDPGGRPTPEAAG